MKKLCSSFLVVERINWTFGVNFLKTFSKLQPTGAAEGFEVFFGEKSNCLIVFGLWAKVTVFWQKNLWQVAKSEFQVSSAELWENMIKVIHNNNIFFRTLGEFFSDFGKKKHSGVSKQ